MYAQYGHNRTLIFQASLCKKLHFWDKCPKTGLTFIVLSHCVGDKLDGYQKKKYVCKLIFIFLLGNNIEFGHQEAVNLLASLRFSEKQIVSAL